MRDKFTTEIDGRVYSWVYAERAWFFVSPDGPIRLTRERVRELDLPTSVGSLADTSHVPPAPKVTL